MVNCMPLCGVLLSQPKGNLMTKQTMDDDADDVAQTAAAKRPETKWEEFKHFTRTLELKFFGGKLYQKATNPHPNEVPDHAWIPVESHNVEAPAPGESIADEPKRRATDATGTGQGAGINRGSSTPLTKPGNEQGSAAATPGPVAP
jgi:hypothetical protein